MKKGLLQNKKEPLGLKILNKKPFFVYLKTLGKLGNIRELGELCIKTQAIQEYFIFLYLHKEENLERLLHKNY